MNSILLSLKPRFCSPIISGAKTLEIRKNHPAVELPFKVYVYCSERNTRNPHHILEVHSEGKIYRCNGRIIGGRGKPLYGWRISSFHLYDSPLDLETICTVEGKPIHRPPQSWCYARLNM